MLTKSWWDAIRDLEPEQTLVVAPIPGSSYPIKEGVVVTGLAEGLDILKKI
jgi:hypothetical protein